MKAKRLSVPQKNISKRCRHIAHPSPHESHPCPLGTAPCKLWVKAHMPRSEEGTAVNTSTSNRSAANLPRTPDFAPPLPRQPRDLAHPSASSSARIPTFTHQASTINTTTMENQDSASEDEIPLPAAKRPNQQPQNPTFNLNAAISQAVMKGRPKNAGPPSSLLRGIGAYATEVGQEGEAAQAEDDHDGEEDTSQPPYSRKRAPTTKSPAPPRRKCQPCATSKKSCPGGHPCSRCVKRSAPEACIEYIPKQTRKQAPSASISSQRPSKRIKPIATANPPPQSAFGTSGSGDNVTNSVEPSTSSTPVKPTSPSTPVIRPNNGPRCKACIARKKGCNRQRPCGRCMDKGLGWEDSVPEDEDD